ncbi:glutaredoxin-related protein 5, mitochondrial [Brienomyrus brachyistius]|uniref:glutaredoxin-related protein 5, mitochondrial n=1 Tax=Brienomyrus brachyistius TaxID=42636 RepID=UPI0020B223CF|nr:glutaredoxin-related protein 5, mitochondrial [Brienomyrus brachyistius]
MSGLFRSVFRAVQLGSATCRPKNFDGHVSVVSARLFCASAGQNDLAEMVKKDKVVVFIKGTPAQPMCGFSNAVVQILRMHGVENYASYNVLEDQDLRQGVKTFSNWPTIPQVFFNGEFVGGCDILLQMHQNGDLVEELKKLGIRSALLDVQNDEKSK